MTDHRMALIVEDDPRHADLYEAVLRSAGFETRKAPSAEAARIILREFPVDLVVSDVRMPGADGLTLLKEIKAGKPGLPFLLVTAFPNVRDAVSALKLGAVNYLQKPVDLEELAVAALDSVGAAASRGAVQPDAAAMASRLRGVVAESPLTKRIYHDALLAAASGVAVLITGESGTGKEVLARFIHENSPHSGGRLLPVNCGAIPANLLASELFGHERGAFTGAHARRTGKFREAHGGTLFLDEIGELPLDLQPTLLRAIETGRVTPVGSDSEETSDFRLVAATNKNLVAEVEAKRFRSDLFYRLNVISFEMPPLRARHEDVMPLCRHFIAGKKDSFGSKRVSPAAVRVLMDYHWPGNVRELFNVLERAMVMSRSDAILPEHFPPNLRAALTRPTALEDELSSPHVRTLEQAERDAIARALSQAGGNRTKAADLLGISRRNLLYKLRLMPSGDIV